MRLRGGRSTADIAPWSPKACRLIVDAEEDIAVVGEADDGEEAVHLTYPTARRPVDGHPHAGARRIAAAERLADENLPSRILLLTTFNQNDYLFRALRAGTSGFLLKSAPAEELVRAIRTVAAGDALLAPAVTRRLIEDFARRPTRQAPPKALDELTPREREILGLMAGGLNNAEIAQELVVSDATVKTHVARVLMKLGLRDRVQAGLRLRARTRGARRPTPRDSNPTR